jgi:hypothetical protein
VGDNVLVQGNDSFQEGEILEQRRMDKGPFKTDKFYYRIRWYNGDVSQLDRRWTVMKDALTGRPESRFVEQGHIFQKMDYRFEI